MSDTETDWTLAFKQLVALLVTVPPVIVVAMHFQPSGDPLTAFLWGVVLSLFMWLAAVHHGLFGNREKAKRFVDR